MNVITWIKVMWKCRYFAKDQRALIYFATKQLDTKKDLCTIEMTAAKLSINRIYALFSSDKPNLEILEKELKELVKDRNEVVKKVQEFDRQLWSRVVRSYLEHNSDETVLRVIGLDKKKMLAEGVEQSFRKM